MKENIPIVISVKCLVANALIELNEANIKKLSFQELSEYGFMVAEKYKSESFGKAEFVFNLEEIHDMLVSYPSYFGIDKGVEKENYIYLKDGVDIQEMKEQFRWVLSYKMLKVLNLIDVKEIVKR